MHQILADHDKQISIQHLRHQQQLGAVMWIAMRSHTLPMSSNRFWLLSTQRCCCPCSCSCHQNCDSGTTTPWLKVLMVWRIEMTVKTSDWLCWLLSSPLMMIITSMYTMGTQLVERTKRPTAIQASCNLILLAIACCMTILLPMCHWIAGLGARRILGDKSLKLRNVQPSAKMAWVYHISSIAAMCVQALHGWFVCLNNIPMMILFEHIFFQKKKLEMTIIIFIVNAIWSKWSPFLLSMMSFKKPSPTK